MKFKVGDEIKIVKCFMPMCRKHLGSVGIVWSIDVMVADMLATNLRIMSLSLIVTRCHTSLCGLIWKIVVN